MFVLDLYIRALDAYIWFHKSSLGQFIKHLNKFTEKPMKKEEYNLQLETPPWEL